MSTPPLQPEPSRPADVARLALMKLRVEEGVSLGSAFQRVTEAAVSVLDVERSGVWLLADERRVLRCVDLFERTKHVHSAGAIMRADEFPEYLAALCRRKTLPAENVIADPRTTRLADAYLVPLGITSTLDAPIYVGGEVIGVVCNEHVGPPREWTTEQRDFAGSMADVLALKIRAAEAEELRGVLREQAPQLAEYRRARELIETAAGIAHDFNNVLGVVLGGADLIATDPSCPPKLIELARQMLAAGQRGTTLAKMLMEFARPGPRDSRVIRPSEVISDQLAGLRAAAGARHTVTLDIRSTAGRVLIDPGQLERVVVNLVVNARDAMPAGGPITVAVDTVAEAGGDIRPGQYVLVEVRDRGTGIPPAVLTKIFDPFFTTKPPGQGTGVGLSVVQQVVGSAGGFVRVETAPDLGSVFRVYLPRVSSS